MATNLQNSSEQLPRKALFAQGYRACDVLLLAFLFGALALVFHSVERYAYKCALINTRGHSF
jgi:hypothetical protein